MSDNMLNTPENTPANQSPRRTSAWSRFWFMVRVIQVRLRFIALLVITGLVIGYWDHVENWYEKRTRAATSHAAEHSPFEYFCPMHPFIVRSDADQKCPICGMPLSQRKKGEKSELPAGVISRVQVSPERVIQAGIEIVDVDYRMLTRKTRVTGVVDYDERRLARVTSRFPGRIEKVFVDYEGAEVKKGDPLVTIYSPKYLAAAEEYVQALQTAQRVGAGGADERRRGDQLAEYARQRLLLAGFEPEQLDEIKRTGKATDLITYYAKIGGIVLERSAFPGQYVGEGEALYTVGDLDNVWVQLQVPEADKGIVRLDEPVEITSVSYSGESFFGNVSFISPEIDAATRSVRVRVEVPNPQRRLLPGMFTTAQITSPVGRFEQVKEEGVSLPPNADVATAQAMDNSTTATVQSASGTDNPDAWAEGYTCSMHPDILRDKPGICDICACGMEMTKWRVEKVLSIPERSVIDTGERKIVYVETAKGVFDAREVKLGPRAGDYYPVIDGLRQGHQIVAAGSFLIDAENRLNPSSPPSHDHDEEETDGAKDANEPTILVKGGYEPEVLTVASDQRKIIFDRRDEGECTDKVVFPSLGIEKELPPFKKTIVELPTTATGEIKYSCGMDMLHGSIVISDKPSKSQDPTVLVKGGYDPEVLKIGAADPRRIVFDRRDEGICTDKIVFPSLGIEKELPPFKKTVVELPTTATGEILYSCGMDMLHGKIIVESAKE